MEEDGGWREKKKVTDSVLQRSGPLKSIPDLIFFFFLTSSLILFVPFPLLVFSILPLSSPHLFSFSSSALALSLPSNPLSSNSSSIYSSPPLPLLLFSL